QPGDEVGDDVQTGPDLVDLLPAGHIPPGYLPVLQAYDYAGDEVTLVHADDIRLRRMAVFDVLINNADRKGGHILSGVDGHVYGVDHGVSLHVDDKLRTVLWGWSGKPVDDESRVHADRVWIVDPVDGTREFSWPGRTDWAVHVALWQRNGGPDGGITDAAVALPARGEVYRTDTVTAPPPRADGPIRITASANRPPAVLWWLRDRLDIQLVGIGSAGAKAM